VAVGLFVGLGVSTVYRAGPYTFGGKQWGSPNHRCDLTVYTAAGQAVLDGTNIYQAHNIRGWYYIYPPLFAILMVPFALMPIFCASLTWYLVSVFLVVWTVKLCVSLVNDGADFPYKDLLLYFLPPLLVLLPLMSALARGQTSPVLLWLVTAGLVYEWKGQHARAAICCAGGILLKVFPVVLLAYFVWRGRWRLVIVTLVAVAIGAFVMPAAVLGWQRNINYLKEWVSVIGKPAMEAESERAETPLYGQLLNSQLPRNQSLTAVLTRLTNHPNARWVGIGIGVVMAAIMVIVGMRTPPDRELHVLSAVVAWMLLIPPVSWSHYFMLLLLPLTALVVTAFTEESVKARRAVVTALIAFAVLGLGLASSRAAQFYGPLCWGALGLWVALVVAIVRRPIAARCE